jgi:hypothetical protein
MTVLWSTNDAQSSSPNVGKNISKRKQIRASITMFDSNDSLIQQGKFDSSWIKIEIYHEDVCETYHYSRCLLAVQAPEKVN